ncbi:MAG: hypothetical protein KC561_14435 [Myxococcales bacterium]|nr:hypothetical protein [Myxococcales bacterium]
MSRPHLPALAGYTLALILIFASLGQADAQFGGTPTDGMQLPERSISSHDDATAVELNPAGLGFLQGWDLHLSYGISEDDSPSGFGIFGAGTLFDAIGIGAGFQVVDNLVLGEFLKFSTGVGATLGPQLSLGLTFNFFSSDAST